MGVQLKKKQSISLRKNIACALCGLGWDAQKVPGKPALDFDLSLFLLGDDMKVPDSNFMIFYNQLEDVNNGKVYVHHAGDDRTGDNSDDGDDEQIKIDLSNVPNVIKNIMVIVTISDAEKRRQVLKDAQRAYVRVCSTQNMEDTDGNEEVSIDLTDELGYETGIVAARIYRDEKGFWSFENVSEGFNGGLEELCDRYGVIVDD